MTHPSKAAEPPNIDTMAPLLCISGTSLNFRCVSSSNRLSYEFPCGSERLHRRTTWRERTNTAKKEGTVGTHTMKSSSSYFAFVKFVPKTFANFEMGG